MQGLRDKRVLITGGAGGIGAATAGRFLQEGARVVLLDCDDAALRRSERELPSLSGTIVADVSDAEAVESAFERLDDLEKGVDILINNAGITRHAKDHGDLDALSRDDFMDVYEVNVVGPYLMLQAAKPLLLAAHEQSGRASAVLNTSSIAGVKGIGSSVAYAASKGALNTMTMSLARGLAPEIRVNAVCPGFIGTRWFKDAMDEAAYQATVQAVEARTPLAAASGPDDIADAAIFFLTDASRHVTGELLLVDAGLHLGKSPVNR